MHAVESGKLNVSELKRPVLVIDVGSSTTDLTLVDVIDKKSKPTDIGRDLGAALIDKAIFRWCLEKNPHQDELRQIFENHPHIRNGCELTCRKAKEEYFSDPQNYQEEGEYAPGGGENIQGRYLFMPQLDGTVMNEILRERIVPYDGELKTWPDAFEIELKKLSQQLQESNQNLFPDAILLTGGASRMDFIDEKCKQLFPQASIIKDDTPEFCIARGLARWGRVEIKTSQFIEDIEKFCSETIKPRVAARIDSLYAGISNTLADNVIRIIKNKFELWKKGNYATIDVMKNHIDQEIKKLMQEKNLSNLFSERIEPILSEIADELEDDIKGIENAYGVPIGLLGASFNLSSHGIGGFSLGPTPGVDVTDGMAEGLGNVVALISGLLASVVTYIVTPIVLVLMVKIVAIISITLAKLIVVILISNPAGWAILAGIGVAGIYAGAKAKKAVLEKLPGWNLPQWVRKLVQSSSVHSKIDEQQGVIVDQVTTKLKGDHNIRQQLTDLITNTFKNSLKEKAEEARLLIS
jgi:hypothetical protein